MFCPRPTARKRPRFSYSHICSDVAQADSLCNDSAQAVSLRDPLLPREDADAAVGELLLKTFGEILCERRVVLKLFGDRVARLIDHHRHVGGYRVVDGVPAE